ncbi:MAG: undecaprenyldiphospho-muramoylpentapeptide beta-N-acetylglucosaminyltransferase [Bacteroidales bacterium]|nr:undecaprenyldiphospho-muramoylpentapeptide beta-N-acetylglucosaminyltransferase [Bacteroidales bacterium]
MKTNRRIIISGGGTGGHIFPALSIAREIIARDPGTEILFVGAKDRMEMEIVPQAGFHIEGLPVEGFQRRLTLKNIFVVFNLFRSLRRAGRIIKTFKPDAVVGVGGYASGPVVRMAVKQGIPVLIQEQNSYAGLTNRILARKANRICVAYEGMEKYFPAQKIVMTGNPVREDLIQAGLKKNEAMEYFGLKADKPVLLVLGGSLGAKTINESIFRNIGMIESSDLIVIWQTGSLYFRDINQKIHERPLKNLIYMDFINRMDLAYAIADVIVSRAGAGTISELCLVGKPVILVPSPNVAEDHQTKNAMMLVNKNAAVLVKDAEAFTQLLPVAFDLIRNNALRMTLEENCRLMALKNAAARIVDELYAILPEP